MIASPSRRAHARRCAAAIERAAVRCESREVRGLLARLAVLNMIAAGYGRPDPGRCSLSEWDDYLAAVAVATEVLR